MKQTICDRCGKEAPDRWELEAKHHSPEGYMDKEEIDLCTRCKGEFRMWLAEPPPMAGPG